PFSVRIWAAASSPRHRAERDVACTCRRVRLQPPATKQSRACRCEPFVSGWLVSPTRADSFSRAPVRPVSSVAPTVTLHVRIGNGRPSCASLAYSRSFQRLIQRLNTSRGMEIAQEAKDMKPPGMELVRSGELPAFLISNDQAAIKIFRQIVELEPALIE